MAKQKLFGCCIAMWSYEPKWTGNCTVCQKWNTFEEDIEIYR